MNIDLNHNALHHVILAIDLVNVIVTTTRSRCASDLVALFGRRVGALRTLSNTISWVSVKITAQSRVPSIVNCFLIDVLAI